MVVMVVVMTFVTMVVMMLMMALMMVLVTVVMTMTVAMTPFLTIACCLLTFAFQMIMFTIFHNTTFFPVDTPHGYRGYFRGQKWEFLSATELQLHYNLFSL
jgi:hypothetical protein